LISAPQFRQFSNSGRKPAGPARGFHSSAPRENILFSGDPFQGAHQQAAANAAAAFYKLLSIHFHGNMPNRPESDQFRVDLLSF